MQNADEDGAIAAAKYYMGLYEYVYLTGDLEMWEEMGENGCEFCDVAIANVTDMHEAGSHRVSGPPKWLGTPRAKRVPSRDKWEVTLRAKVSASTTYDADGRIIAENVSGKATVGLAMEYTPSGWKVAGITVETDD